MLKKTQNCKTEDIPRSGLIGPDLRRGEFWNYCRTAASGARARSSAKGVAYAIDAHFIDQLFVDQRWRCAVSGIEFSRPKSGTSANRQDAFGPSLDRIKPAAGYVRGNVRLVCNIVNATMNQWGLEALLTMLDAVKANRRAGTKQS